ncbi:MAG TPA: carbohydrate kinase [Thermomicrobiales bacterium]|nr:carbohydrate kinase [Thermomicrobiales bacterium]
MVDPNRPVVSIGECLVDLIAENQLDLLHADRFAVREGGAPANVAVALARLGVPVMLCAVVGRDPFGYRLRDILQNEGVDTRALRMTSEAATSLALAWTNARGDGEFQLLRLADRLLSSNDAEAARPWEASALVAGSVVLSDSESRRGAVAALDLAVSNLVPVVFDLNLRPTLWRSMEQVRLAVEQFLHSARVIKVSMDDARGVWGIETPQEALDRLASYSARTTIVTDGGRGVWYRNERKTARSIPVFSVDVVEPTGAGDAFTAAITSRLLASSWMPVTDEDVRFAMAAGALATTKPGAWPGLPTARAVEVFLRDRE